VITETKENLKATKMIGNYTMLYSGVSQKTRAQPGVALITDQKWTSRITNYSFVNDRIITVRLKANRGHIAIIAVYAPEEGREEETRRFYKQLQKEDGKCNKNGSLIISGDLNARVGNQPIPNVVGTFGGRLRGQKWTDIKRICIFQRFQNCQHFFFKKNEIHKYTWSARGSKTVIDNIIVNRRPKNLVQDIKIFRGSDIGSDHFLVT